MTVVETGTRALVGAAFGTPADGELTRARRLLDHLDAGMLVLADCGFDAAKFLAELDAAEARFLVRIKAGRRLPAIGRLPDGTTLSVIGGVKVRITVNDIRTHLNRSSDFRMTNCAHGARLGALLELPDVSFLIADNDDQTYDVSSFSRRVTLIANEVRGEQLATILARFLSSMPTPAPVVALAAAPLQQAEKRPVTSPALRRSISRRRGNPFPAPGSTSRSP